MRNERIPYVRLLCLLYTIIFHVSLIGSEDILNKGPNLVENNEETEDLFDDSESSGNLLSLLPVDLPARNVTSVDDLIKKWKLRQNSDFDWVKPYSYNPPVWNNDDLPSVEDIKIPQYTTTYTTTTTDTSNGGTWFIIIPIGLIKALCYGGYYYKKSKRPYLETVESERPLHPTSNTGSFVHRDVVQVPIPLPPPPPPQPKPPPPPPKYEDVIKQDAVQAPPPPKYEDVMKKNARGACYSV